MNTILAVVRESTEAQEVESQKAELKDFCTKLGYTNIIWIAVAGASARKANQKYLEMLDSIKNTIIANDIKAVAFWHLNRLGRKESYIMQMKEWFVNNKIQVYVKNPTLTLLKEDGSLDAGANIAWSVFASMVAYDTEEMFAKTSRGKARNKAEGKANGGMASIPFGYTKDGSGYIIPNWDEVETVKLIFTEFATGNYSINSFVRELKSRGITNRKGKNFSCSSLDKMLRSTVYLGEGKTGRKYEPVISKELYDLANSKRTDRGKVFKGNVRCNLAIKVLKCADCGHNYFASGDYYKCYLNYKQNAINTNNEICKAATINVDVMDDLLWDIASKMHITYMNGANEKSLEEANKELAILKVKKGELYKNLSKVNDAKARAKKMYLDLDLTDEEYEKEKTRIGIRFINITKEINVVEANITKLEDTITNITNPDKMPLLSNILHSTKEEKRTIIRKHIEKAYVKFEGNYKVIEIYPVGREVMRYKYDYRNKWSKDRISQL